MIDTIRLFAPDADRTAVSILGPTSEVSVGEFVHPGTLMRDVICAEISVDDANRVLARVRRPRDHLDRVSVRFTRGTTSSGVRLSASALRAALSRQP